MTSPTQNRPSAGSTEKEEFKDLGFGSEVARGTRRRLLNRDGSFNVVLEGLNPLSSLGLYHWLLTISWPRFLGFIAATYVAINGLFAEAYLLCGPDALQSSAGYFANQPFYRAFFFSVDTFATIGYGNIVPVGVVPNTLVTIEALLNIVGVALATGVIFARFSRPSARIVYSSKAIVAPYRGKTALEFRIANARSSQLIDVEVQAILTKIEQVGGTTVRKFHELELERNRVVFFPLSWTVVHPIGPESPMWGMNPAIALFGVLAAFTIANYTYQGAQPFYNAMMSELVPVDHRGRLSGLGTALGYVGSITGVILTFPFFTGQMPILGKVPEKVVEFLRSAVPFTAPGGRVSTFAPTALLFLIFSLPLFIFCRDHNVIRGKRVACRDQNRTAVPQSAFLGWPCRQDTARAETKVRNREPIRRSPDGDWSSAAAGKSLYPSSPTCSRLCW